MPRTPDRWRTPCALALSLTLVPAAHAVLPKPEPAQAVPVAQWQTDEADVTYGFAVAGLGDVDGDGIDDVAVGVPGADGDAGRVEVYRGTPGAWPTAPDWTWTAPSGGRAGAALASGCDVDGDGLGDLVVGAPQANRVHLFLGAPGGLPDAPTLTLTGPDDALFGHAVACAGDVDGDGDHEVVVGSPGFDDPDGDAVGAADLFEGSPTGLSPTASWHTEGRFDLDQHGWDVDGAGDVDGDGHADVVVGTRQWQTAEGVFAMYGAVALYRGGPTGLADTPVWERTGDTLFGEVGSCVAGAGDIDGDGYDDLLLGQQSHTDPEDDEGRMRLFLGGPTGPSPTPDWAVSPDVPLAMMGFTCQGVGDLNGDGLDDLFVSAPFHDDPVYRHGKAWLYPGHPTGPSSTPDAIATFLEESAHLGRAYAPAGDLDADGFADLLVALPYWGNDLGGQGGVFVLAGSPWGLSNRNEPPTLPVPTGPLPPVPEGPLQLTFAPATDPEDDPIAYDLELVDSTDTPLATLQDWSPTPAGPHTYDPGVTIPPGQTVRWRVRSEDAYGSRGWTAWQTVRVEGGGDTGSPEEPVADRGDGDPQPDGITDVPAVGGAGCGCVQGAGGFGGLVGVVLVGVVGRRRRGAWVGS